MSHKPFRVGERVELHPATDEWMQGERYGVVVGYGKPQHWRDTDTQETGTVVPVRVRLDKSTRTRRFHPDNLTSTGEFDSDTTGVNPPKRRWDTPERARQHRRAAEDEGDVAEAARWRERENDEPGEPDEEDVTADDPGGPFFYLRTHIAKDRAELKQWMTDNNFFPNVWWVSDHGNAHLITDL